MLAPSSLQPSGMHPMDRSMPMKPLISNMTSPWDSSRAVLTARLSVMVLHSPGEHLSIDTVFSTNEKTSGFLAIRAGPDADCVSWKVQERP